MTQEKTFDEMFPELKNFEYLFDLSLKEGVQKHCLSKQRVKEAIDSIKITPEMCMALGKGFNECFRWELKKRLGLK